MVQHNLPNIKSNAQKNHVPVDWGATDHVLSNAIQAGKQHHYHYFIESAKKVSEYTS